MASLLGAGRLRKALHQLGHTNERVSGKQVSVSTRAGAGQRKHA